MSEYWRLIYDAEAKRIELEFTMTDGKVYKGIPGNIVLMESDDGKEYEDCTLNERGTEKPLVAISLDDVVSVRRLDQPDTVIYAPKIAA